MTKTETLSGKEMLVEKKKFNVFDMIGGIFKPILIVIVGAGVLQTLRDILVQTGAISKVSSSYIFLDGLGSAAFYFLPIFLAISSANVFKATPYLAAAVAAFLLFPNITNLFSWANSVGWNLTLFGKIPITYVKYESSVLPIILIIFFQSKIEPLLKKVIPDLLRSILFPVLTLFITCLAGIIILGPLGTWAGDGLAFVITWINGLAPWLVPTLVGAASPFLVITGSHYSLFPVATQNLAQLGYDTVLMPGMMASNIALAGASFAVAIRAKQKSYKSYCASSGLTSFFGISQSSLYGIAIPLKKPLITSVIGGGIAGFYAGISGIQARSFSTPGLLSLVGYSSPTSNLINALICIVIAFVATFILTFLAGFQEPSRETVRELTGEPISEEEKQEIIEKAEELEAAAREAEEALGDASMEVTRATIARGATRLGETTGLVSPTEDETGEEDDQKGGDA
ncbi:MAG TPA: PTS transporter subunit EIIC [Clostridiaceae bacterium]|jgi:PTS system beta-glucosides-specific IIC component|nr:PTS transporter subunit EIIC [Clostridiaceae bacterium]